MLKRFFTTSRLNVLLHLEYIPSKENPADFPSLRLSSLDCQLMQGMWATAQHLFGGQGGHTCDLMALDSNAMRDRQGEPLHHFTPYASPGSSGVNVFSQGLSLHSAILQKAYVFPPLVLVGPLLCFLVSYKQSCTVVVFDTYPRKYWWPIVQYRSQESYKLAPKGSSSASSRRQRKDGRPTPVS